jgi:hypothetical protein
MTTVEEVAALLAQRFGSHVYYLARCGHVAEAPAPSRDAELQLGGSVECPECHLPRRVIGYVPVEDVR